MPHVGDVDDLRKTVRGRSAVTCAPQPSWWGYGATRPAFLVRADDVRVPRDLHGDHRLGFPLVLPEERTDDLDFRVGEPVLIVADVLDHQPVRSAVAVLTRADITRLPGKQQRARGHAGQESGRVEL